MATERIVVNTARLKGAVHLVHGWYTLALNDSSNFGHGTVLDFVRTLSSRIHFFSVKYQKTNSAFTRSSCVIILALADSNYVQVECDKDTDQKTRMCSLNAPWTLSEDK